MKNKFLSILFSALFSFGCAPIALYQCKGGASGATEWHTVEARGTEAAQNNGEFAECRAMKGTPTESTVSVEYAGAGPFDNIPENMKHLVGTGYRCEAYRQEQFRWLDGTTTKEVFRAHIEFGMLSVAQMLTRSEVDKLSNDHHDQNVAIMKSWIPIVLNPEVKDTSNGSERYLKIKCWSMDQPMPDDVLKWPTSTWPKNTSTPPNNDTYTCDAYAEYISDNSGTISAVRKQWTSVMYEISTVHSKGKDLSTVVFLSGDPELDKRYRQTAPLFKGKIDVMDWMTRQPKNEVIAIARSKNVEPPRDVEKKLRTRQANAVCWRNGDKAPNRSGWPTQSTDNGSKKCREWSSLANKFVEVEREGLRFQCVKELQAYCLQQSSDGVYERGATLFPTRTERNLCGPETHADSGVEAALRRDAEATCNYQIADYGGRCWEMGKPKPPIPSSWSGQNGAW